MLLRAATPDDAAGIAQLVVAASFHAFEDLVGPRGLAVLDTERETGEWRLRLAEPWDHVVFVATHGDRILGVAAWLVPRGPSFTPAENGILTHLYVHPAAQGAGLGRRLLRHAEEELRVIGGRTAQLSLHQGNTWTAQLLASEGWAQQPDTPVDALPNHAWTRTL